MIIQFRPYRFMHRALCWFLIAVMAMTQSVGIQSAGMAAAQPRETADSRPIAPTGGHASAPEARLDLTYCTGRACAALFVHPRRVLNDPAMEMLPIEVITAAGVKEIGINPLDVEEVQAFIEPPMAGPPSFVIVVKFAKPFRVSDLKQQIREHTVLGALNGMQYFQSQHPMMPSFFMPDAKTLLVATDEMLNRIVAGPEESASSPLLDMLNSAHASDVYVLINIDMLRPLVEAGLHQVRQADNVPPPIAPFLNAPSLIRSIDASINLVAEGPTQLVVYANDEDGAKQLETLVDNGLAMMRQQMLSELARQEQSDDPVKRAVVQYMKRISGRMSDLYRPLRDGDKLVLGGQPGENEQQLYSFATIGILVALLLPAVQAAREAARRTSCVNNMKQIMLGLLNYESSHGYFPAQANFDEDGKPLLSWRVHILPYLEEQTLFDQFHLNEPWDSPHNKKLIDQIPQIYSCPSSPLQGAKTTYLMPQGKGLFLEGKERITLRQITDGTSNTAALVEVKDKHAVIWTRPDDLEWNPKKPLAKLGSCHPGIFSMAFVDGHIQVISMDIDAKVLKSMFTRNGGEKIDGGRY